MARIDASSRLETGASIKGLLVVGQDGGTHLGGSFLRAAGRLGIPSVLCNSNAAFSQHRLLNWCYFHLGERTAPNGAGLEASILEVLRARGVDTLLTTGTAQVTRSLVERCRALGVTALHFSTDDPWNKRIGSSWYFEALTAYDVVFTPRLSNFGDFERMGCRKVAYLPFGFDPEIPDKHTSQTRSSGPTPDVLFVGGADSDRVDFFLRYINSGAPVTLAGAYWENHRGLRERSIGKLELDGLVASTKAAKVNLCLVRRANRDGHVMRTFEIACLGGCLLAEATFEHRDLLGAEGHAALYFATPEEAAKKALFLLDNPELRKIMATRLRDEVISGKHSYDDRLKEILIRVRESTQKTEG